jgi:hypothetical protein
LFEFFCTFFLFLPCDLRAFADEALGGLAIKALFPGAAALVLPQGVLGVMGLDLFGLWEFLVLHQLSIIIYNTRGNGK